MKTLEGKVADSLYYSKEKFLDMEERTKHMGGLLAAADEEAEESQEEIEHLKKALQVEWATGGSKSGHTYFNTCLPLAKLRLG